MNDFSNLSGPRVARYRPERPVTVVIDGDEIANVITIKPSAFAISRRQIASELRDLIANWMETRAA